LSFSSATSIRKHFFEGFRTQTSCTFDANDVFLQNNLPQSSLNIISNEFLSGRGPVFPESFESILLHLLRSISKDKLSHLPYMGEGLENRLKQAALKAVSFGELVSSVVTSRYPASRIKRILFSLLTDMSGEFLDELKVNGYAQYIRILGFNDTGRELLSLMRKKAELPIITKAANYTKLLNPLAKKLFEHEIRASDSYVLGFPASKARLGGSEFTTSPIQVGDGS
jgi:predicted nucleotidyltransferase